MTKRSVKPAMRVALGLVLVLAAAAPARAATISLGWWSFDQFIPPDPMVPESVGTNAFNIFNSTGDFAFFAENPDSSVTFENAVMQLTSSSGDSLNVDIGHIHPGFLDDGLGNPLFDLQFAETLTFTSAVFTATLSTSSFRLSDGSTFLATSPHLLFFLGSPDGSPEPNPLLAGFASVELLVEGDIVAVPVPEPSTLVLLGSGLAAALRLRRRV